MTPRPLPIFHVDDGACARTIAAQKLTLTEAGWAKFWIGLRLVGVFKSWSRIYVEKAT